MMNSCTLCTSLFVVISIFKSGFIMKLLVFIVNSYKSCASKIWAKWMNVYSYSQIFYTDTHHSRRVYTNIYIYYRSQTLVRKFKMFLVHTAKPKPAKLTRCMNSAIYVYVFYQEPKRLCVCATRQKMKKKQHISEKQKENEKKSHIKHRATFIQFCYFIFLFCIFWKNTAFARMFFSLKQSLFLNAWWHEGVNFEWWDKRIGTNNEEKKEANICENRE